MPKQILVSDESLNSQNYRVVTAGIDTSRFLKNPIMLLNHNRLSRWSGKDAILALGTWEDLRIKGKKVYATPVFDEEDEFANKIKGKFERGVYRSASIGIIPTKVIEITDEKNGTSYYEIRECILFEISICDIPSNKNAVAFYDSSEKPLEFSDVIELAAPTQGIKPKVSTTMKENRFSFVPVTLGLSADATQEAVVKKIGELKLLEAKNIELTAANKDLESKIAKLQKGEIVTLVDKAIAANKIPKALRDTYIKLAGQDLETVKAAFNVMPESKSDEVRLSDLPTKEVELGDEKGGKKTYLGMSFLELQKKNPEALIKLQVDDYKQFCELYKSEYGTDYKRD